MAQPSAVQMCASCKGYGAMRSDGCSACGNTGFTLTETYLIACGHCIGDGSCVACGGTGHAVEKVMPWMKPAQFIGSIPGLPLPVGLLVVCYDEQWYLVPDQLGGWADRTLTWLPQAFAKVQEWPELTARQQAMWERVTHVGEEQRDE